MAVTVTAEPQNFTPAYNPMYFYLDSTNKATLGFRYLVDVIYPTTTDSIGTYRLKPIPTSLLGEVDIAKIIQTQLSAYLSLNNSFINDNHFFKYRLDIKEEYFVTHPFTSYVFAGASNWPNHGDPSINPNGFNRTCVVSSTLPPYVAGDVINITQTPSVNFRPELEGVHTVLDVFLDGGLYYIVLDLLWIRLKPPSAGTISYADGRKTIFDGITTDVKSAWKGAFPFTTFKDYSDTDYQLGDVSKKLLTSLPQSVRISRDTRSWLSCYIPNGSAYYAVFDVDGTLYRYQINTIADKISNFNILPSGNAVNQTWNGSSWVAFGGVVDLTGIESYTVQVQTTVPVSELVTVNLYSECDFHDTYDITFLDRMNSWITIPFNKGSYMNQEVTRQSYRQKYGGLNVDSWQYDTIDRGNEIYSVDENITYTVNTGILSQVESQYIKELISTPQAFVSINGSRMQSIVIDTSSQALHLRRTARDRKVSLSFKMAVQDEING